MHDDGEFVLVAESGTGAQHVMSTVYHSRQVADDAKAAYHRRGPEYTAYVVRELAPRIEPEDEEHRG